MSKIRRNFSKEFKKKVVLEALKERSTLEVLAKKYELQPTQISLWKAQALSNFENVFSEGNSASEKKKEADLQMLYAQIGEQKMAIDFLKKKLL
jgi:transposase-like protein